LARGGRDVEDLVLGTEKKKKGEEVKSFLEMKSREEKIQEIISKVEVS